MPVNMDLVEARQRARLSQQDLARRVREAGRRTGTQNGCNRNTIARWEAGEAIPQPRMLAALEQALGASAADLGFGGTASEALPLVPRAFPATALAGPWVTCYQFTHEGKQLHHADVARVTADSESRVRAANGPARTEGRTVAFRNEIRAQLASRHLLGTWRNTSDMRYFGSLHLAVLPGETVMDGYYTGFASDVVVSMARWKWARLDPAADPAGISLAEPHVLYKVVMEHSQYDVPLALADIAEGTTP